MGEPEEAVTAAEASGTAFDATVETHDGAEPEAGGSAGDSGAGETDADEAEADGE